MAAWYLCFLRPGTANVRISCHPENPQLTPLLCPPSSPSPCVLRWSSETRWPMSSYTTWWVSGWPLQASSKPSRWWAWSGRARPPLSRWRTPCPIQWPSPRNAGCPTSACPPSSWCQPTPRYSLCQGPPDSWERSLWTHVLIPEFGPTLAVGREAGLMAQSHSCSLLSSTAQVLTETTGTLELWFRHVKGTFYYEPLPLFMCLPFQIFLSLANY